MKKPHPSTGKKLKTLHVDFWNTVNVDYLTEQVRIFCESNYKSDWALSSHCLNVSQRRIYHIIEGNKKVNTLTWEEFKRVLDKMGYRVQFKIVPK